MTPIIADSSARNGSAAIAIFVPNRRTLNSSTIKITGIAALKAKPPSKRFRRRALSPFYLLLASSFLISITSRKERSPSSALFAVIANWISLESILKSPRNLFTPMSGLKSLLTYNKSRSIREKNWLRLFRTNYLLGFPQTSKQGKRCRDT